MPNCAARKLLDLLGADVSCPRRCARMRAMVPRVTIAGDDREAESDSWLGPGDRSRQSRSFADDSAGSSTDCCLPASLKNWSAWLSCFFWQTPHPAHIGALPALGHVPTELIPQESFNSNNLPDRLLARDLQSYHRQFVGRGSLERAWPVILSRLFPYAKEVRCSVSKYAIRLTL
jgi:hypothetical protein